jgi:hypothetical protein
MKTRLFRSLIVAAIFTLGLLLKPINLNATSCVLVNVGETKNASYALFEACGDTVYVYGELVVIGNIDLTDLPPITLIVDAHSPGDTAMIRFPTGTNNLRLPENSVLILANGGYLEGDPACSNTDRIFIGSLSYARCKGIGNAEYEFDDLNSRGGSIRTTITASPNELCLEESGFNVKSTVAGGFEEDRIIRLWVTPPGGSEILVYEDDDVFDIDFEYNETADLGLGSYKYSLPGDYILRTRSQDNLGFWHDASVTVKVYPLPEATFTGSLGACISTTLTPDALTGATTYFQGTNDDGFDESVTGPVVIEASGTYYFRAKSDFGCWGPSVPAEVVIDNSEGGETNTTDNNVCLGSEVMIELDNYSGTIKRWEKEMPRGSGSWVHIANTTDELYDTPSSSGIYRYRALVEGAICPEVYSDATDIYVNSPDGILEADGMGECEVNNEEWIHLFDFASNKIIASVQNTSAQNLGVVSASVFYHSDPRLITGEGHCGVETQAVMNRNFVINSEIKPDEPVRVRFYFTDEELGKLINASITSRDTEGALSVPFGDPTGCEDNDDVLSINHLAVTQIHFEDETERSLYENGEFDAGIGRFILHHDFAITNSGTGNANFSANFVEITVTEFSEFWIHGTESGYPLPVELLSFEATAVNNEYIKLNWSTATEINNDGFEVQKSTDGINFTKIGWVKGMGNTTNKQDYLFNDMEPFDGVNYYRLKQIDYNGDFEYSPIVAATITSNGGFQMADLYPNPARDIINLDLMMHNFGNIKYTVYNTIGQPVLVETGVMTKGKNTVQINTANLPAGTYMLTVEQADKVETKRFVVFR